MFSTKPKVNKVFECLFLVLGYMRICSWSISGIQQFTAPWCILDYIFFNILYAVVFLFVMSFLIWFFEWVASG